MSRHFLLTLFLGVAAACSPADKDQPPSGENSPAAIISESPPGKTAYDRACAHCHEEGLDGAPAVGDQEAWADRSSLWVAVLAEHANKGYLDMPAKGGDASISDREVADAAVYMLTLTHPDRPPD